MEPDHDVVLIGAGFSGIGTAIKLDQAGIDDWVVLEAGDGVGGTWHWNTYPGVGVDIPSFSYQFSFEQRTDWSRVYAPGGELKAYAEHCVDTYGLRSRIRLNTKVAVARFDDEHHGWRLTIAGSVMHTARWDHEEDLRGRRVAIVGTGASAVQIIPSIAPEVEELVETMLSRRGRQVFFRDSCATANSYYFDSHGDVPFRSATTLEVAWRSARFDLDDYRFTQLRGMDPAPAPATI